jgi:intein/homing endonuclease
MEEGRRKIIFSRPAISQEFRKHINNEDAIPKVALPRHPDARELYWKQAEEANLLSPFPRNAVSRDAQKMGFTKEAAYRDAVMARPRYYDPIRSYTLIGIPFQMQLEAERKKIRQWCRFYMMTHHMVPTCHPEGTQIDVGGNWENIEDVEIGDIVRTHNGRYRPIKELKTFDYLGNIYRFTSNKNNNEIEVTPEHPLYIFDGNDYSWKLPKEIEVGEYLVSPVLKEVEDKEEILYEILSEWERDPVYTYKGTRKIPKTKCQRKASLRLEVTPDLMRLIGYYLSDGSATERGKFRLDFGLHERDYAEDATKLIEKCLGKKAKIYRERNMWEVSFCSKPFCRWLREEFGHSALEKRIPLWVQKLPTEKQSQLVIGFWRGDGCSTKDEIVFDSKSVDLIWGLQTILHRMGYSASLRIPKECFEIRQINEQVPSVITTSLGRISITGESAQDFACNHLDIPWKERTRKWYKMPRGFLDNGYMHYRIDSKDEIMYRGKVYNFEVEEDESYVANGFVSHNCIEIFSRFPLIGFENTCKDSAIQEFYDDLFLDENRLDYVNFLIQLGLEYWQVGEAYAFGEWSDDLGCWTSEELLDPDLVEVQYFPLLKSRAFKMKIPEHLRNLVTKKEPKEEYEVLRDQMGELLPYIMKNEAIPIDASLLTQLKCGGPPWESHGIPILMRAFRQLMLEEKLNMSQMAIAERMYLPLLVGKLGSAGYGQDGVAWIPTNEQLSALRDDVELAMSSDFRFLATHFAVEFSNVWGREVIPDMTQDYAQIEKRILTVFGISESLISGQANQPYASTALSADFLNQRLRSYQSEIKKHVKDRYRAVAEAQEFFDYETKGGRLIPVYEEYIVVDPETGNKERKSKRKLLIPEPIMRVMDLRDEATQREFLFKLKEAGVPVADSTMLFGVEFGFEDELEKTLDQARAKIIAQQRSNNQLYKELKEEGLPIPEWLRAEVAGIAPEEKPEGVPEMGGMGAPGMGGMMGGAEPEIPGAVEGLEGMEAPETEKEEGGAIIKPLPQNRSKPEESTEQMGTMPKATSLQAKLKKISEKEATGK